jgi:predicted TIM-barrel fold metal-dependent hydrolase
MYPWPLGSFDFTKPEYIYYLKKQVPDAIILVGHMAYHHFMHLEALAWQPGIFIETSFGLEMIANLYGIKFAERFIHRIGSDNVVFGSDWMGTQDGDIRITDNNFNLFDKMNLTKVEKAKILGENIKEILGL